jgi:hypothetical protein
MIQKSGLSSGPTFFSAASFVFNDRNFGAAMRWLNTLHLPIIVKSSLQQAVEAHRVVRRRGSHIL